MAVLAYVSKVLLECSRLLRLEVELMASDPEFARLGPWLPREGNAYWENWTYAMKRLVADRTGCSVSYRFRKHWNSKMLVVRGPPDQLFHALRCARYLLDSQLNHGGGPSAGGPPPPPPLPPPLHDILDKDIFDGTQVSEDLNRMVVDEIDEIIKTLCDRIQQWLQEIYTNRLYWEAAESRGLSDQLMDILDTGTQVIEYYNQMVVDEIEEIMKTLGVRIRQAEQRLQELYREDAETPDLRNLDPWSVGVTYREITSRMIKLNSEP